MLLGGSKVACARDFFGSVHTRCNFGYMQLTVTEEVACVVVGEPRDPNKANRTKVKQIAKFGMIVYYKIVINNLI